MPEHCPDWDGAHEWTTVDATIAGQNGFDTTVIERCERCGDLRVDEDVEVLE